MTRPKVTIASSVSLESSLGGLGHRRWMELLDEIGRSKSISAAARQVGLSYKAAWDAVDSMNNLAGRPVVATTVGGKGGGGARLTPHGREVVETYRAAAAENERFLERLNARIGDSRPRLRALGRLLLRTSARNQWWGEIRRIRRGSVNDEVEVELGGGTRVVAVVTHESARHLGFRAGAPVIALVKASSIIVAPGDAPALALSARNQLRGRVARVVPGKVNSEIVIALRGGNTVAAIVTRESAKTLQLAVGRAATAIFKASAVILAAG